MDLKTHISHFINGMKYTDTIDDVLNYITTKRDLYRLANEFKFLYDLDTCALGHDDLFLRIITDDGLKDVFVHRIK